MKIIVCDRCFNIPKLTIINKKEVKCECENCNRQLTLSLGYFDIFRNANENNDLFALPNCSSQNHNSRAVLYCFKCSRYLCNDCLNTHIRGRGHITINQKISHKYFCPKRLHEDNVLNIFCKRCNNYLCRDCRCLHNNDDKYFFEDEENLVNEIKNNIHRCEEIIQKEERNFNNMKRRLEEKINKLTNLFNDYKQRNTNLINFYNLLINNYEQLRDINNYNIRNNLFLNNNFDLRNSIIYNGECLVSDYYRLSEFYRNTNHIKTKKFATYYMTTKFCYGTIKKCVFINENATAYCFEDGEEKHIHFIYKNNKNEMKRIRMFYDNFIKTIFPLKDNNYLYLDENNKLTISSIKIDEKLNSSSIISFQDINFVISDEYNKNNFFAISNSDKSSFFIIKYYMKDSRQDSDEDYQNSNENKDNMFLLFKEIKTFNNILFDDIKRIIDESSFYNNEKNELKAIFGTENINNINIDNLIDSNKRFLNFIRRINENIYNRYRNEINLIQNDYVINSTYIIQLITSINQNHLNQNERNEINHVIDANNFCERIMEKYIPYLVFNSKINNIYNYNNKFLLFMGEKYFLIPYSINEKKFFGLKTLHLIQANDNYNNYEIIQILSNKIILNNSKDKIINIIENRDAYNFFLVNRQFNYYSNVQVYKNKLLFDKVNNNNLWFSLINLNNYSSVDYDKFSQIINFKINNNPPKILANKNLSKFVYLFEDNNQISEIDFSLYENINFREEINNIVEIRLTKENRREVIPTINKYSSFYDKDYSPNNILYEKNYFCTRNNRDEFIIFQFDREYCFYKIYITFPDSYKKARLKKYQIIGYDNQGRLVKTCTFTSDGKNDSDFKYLNVTVDFKAAYLKFELIENFGENYFCIQRIQFYADIIHRVSAN